ncbi:MAG: VOC family protein [Acidobacteria bacterium]|nr:VOC family protein [Acidobacteriota bacterium]
MASAERVLETCLYVNDLATAKRFYLDLFHFLILFEDERLCALDAGSASVLLLFVKGMSTEPIPTPGGNIPPHDGSGPEHIALAIKADQYDSWLNELAAHNIVIESEVRWPRGGRSIYFRDPDDHLVELATPGLWATY